MRDVIRNDQRFVTYVDTVDFIQCGDQLIVYGIVNDDRAKSDIELKIKEIQGIPHIQNKIIVK